MDRIYSITNSFWQLYLTLPLITQWAVAALISCALIAHFFSFKETTVHEGPSIFTTAGIFFTFLGIAEGLYEFKPQDIDASIPALLDGLKTAFIASVVGVGAALSIKLRFVIFGFKDDDRAVPSDGATVDDLYRQLARIQESLVGPDRTSIGEQMQLSRTDTNNRLDTIAKSQSTFMKTITDDLSPKLHPAMGRIL